MKTSVFIAVSMDGYIARENGDLEWLTGIEGPEGEDYGYGDFIKTIDAIVMGRGSYEKVITFSEWLYTKPVFVLSSKLKQLPENMPEKAQLLSMEPGEVIQYLNDLGHYHIYVDGGRTIQRFLTHDLIDEIIITTIPLLIGSGIPLFGNPGRDLGFRHLETTVYPNGLVKNHYKRNR